MFKIGYIKTDGSFLNVIDEGFMNHAHYELNLINKGELERPDVRTERQLVNRNNWIRVNDGSNVRGENIVELPIKPITSEQYSALLNFLDYMMYHNKQFIDIGIEERFSTVHFTNNALWFKHYDFKDYLPDDIIKEIRQQYNKIKATMDV